MAALDYGVGDTVRHIKFGVGIVTAVTKGGKDYEVTVDFPNFGTKKLLSSFAKLIKVI
jgi:DNA helicase-2/ATP-dependent DNA helicase PcrA